MPAAGADRPGNCGAGRDRPRRAAPQPGPRAPGVLPPGRPWPGWPGRSIRPYFIMTAATSTCELPRTRPGSSCGTARTAGRRTGPGRAGTGPGWPGLPARTSWTARRCRRRTGALMVRRVAGAVPAQARAPSSRSARHRDLRTVGSPRQAAVGEAFTCRRNNSPPVVPTAEKLALIYKEQGLRPAEIADKLGVSVYTVPQIILARNGAKG